MPQIRIPNPDRKKALIVVDVQKGFMTKENEWVVPIIKDFIQKTKYEVIVETNFEASENSLWNKQLRSVQELEPTLQQIKEILPKEVITVVKSSKSAFKGDKDLVALFKEKQIEEVHIIGVDTHDCVLATATESFDYGFFTYVIEECTASSQGNEFRETTFKIMREVELTNTSQFIENYSTIEV